MAYLDNVIERRRALGPPRIFIVDWKLLSLLCLSIWTVFIALELKQPYYFLQDDNRDYLLPDIVHSYRSLAAGEIAQYNPHQYSGTPFLATGVAGTLFPLTYLSAWASLAIFGHYYASIDILVLIHLTAGAIGVFLLLRLIFADGRAALFGALAWPLNSFGIYVTSSWFWVGAVIAYCPWMAYFAVKCASRFTRWRFAAIIASRLLLLSAGHVQYFIYTALLEVMVFAFAWAIRLREHRDRVAGARSCMDYIATWLCFVLLAMPLLLPMWHQTALSATRSAPLSWTEFNNGSYRLDHWLTGLLNPFSSKCDLPTPALGWENTSLYHLGHIGYLSLLLMPAGLAAIFGNSRKRHWVISFAAAGLLLLLCSMNAFAWVAYHLPIINRFRWTFKFQLFVNFFLLLIAAAGVAQVLSRLQRGPWARVAFALVFCGTLLNFLLLYTICPPRAFRTHVDRVPLEEPLQSRIGDGKVITIGFHWEDQRSLPSLGYNYATLWGVYHVAGYDPLVTRDNAIAGLWMNHFASYNDSLDDLPLDTLRTLAVRYYVVAAYSPQYGPGLLARGMHLFYKDAWRTVYRDPEAKSLIYEEKKGHNIEYDISANAIRVKVRQNVPDRLHIGFLWNEFFSAVMDKDRPVRIGKGSAGQMIIDVPAGSHTVVLKYRDPYYARGLWVAGFTLFILGLCLWRPALVTGRA